MPRLLSFLLLFLVSFAGFAEKGLDSTYMHFYKKRLLVRGFLGSKDFRQHYGSTVLENHRQLYAGVAGHYNGVGGHIWFSLPVYLEDQPRGENQRVFDFQGNYYRNRMVYDLNFQYHRGLYQKDEFREDVEVVNFNANAVYAFNRQFAIPAGFIQTIRQTKLMGSFLVSAGGLFQRTEADSTLSLLTTTLNETDVKLHETAIYLGGGYGINIPIKKFFVSFMGTIGPSLQFHNLTDTRTTVGLHYTGRLGMGYSGERYIGGITFVSDGHFHSIEGKDRLGIKQHVKVFFGFRIGYEMNPKSKFLRKFFNL